MQFDNVVLGFVSIFLIMAKCTIISLILIDFVPIFSYSACFEKNLGGHSTSKRSQVQKSPKLILGGGSTHFNKVPSSKKSQPR